MDQIEAVPQNFKWPLLLQVYTTLQAQFRSSISSWLQQHRNWRQNFSRQKMVDRFLANIRGGKKSHSMSRVALTKVKRCFTCYIAQLRGHCYGCFFLLLGDVHFRAFCCGRVDVNRCRITSGYFPKMSLQGLYSLSPWQR